ncbi:MAG: hypothetical protein NWQ21_06375, partial [Desulfobacterales bacterium]|nr:hypothetical protein [Desulfobacterales bacterium]MDP4979062.1 hypothetical protein [Desulfobacterales bacterium]
TVKEEMHMQQGSKFFTIIAVLVIGVMLQIMLVFADQREAPAKTAVAFSKAYFELDPAMVKYLCSAFTTNEEGDVVAEYLNRMADDARVVGFDRNYMRSRLYSVHTQVISQSDTEAEVRILAERKRNINPIFTVVGRLFSIGETYPVDETLKLVKEDGRWKVCGRAFSLTV